MVTHDSPRLPYVPRWIRICLLLLMTLTPALPDRATAQAPAPSSAQMVPAALQPCGPTIAIGDTMTCAISAAAETDSVQFAGASGDVLLLRVGVTAGTMTPVVRVFGPGGIKQCEAVSASSASVEISRCALASSGTYTITVGDYNATRVGSYTVYVQRLNGPVGTRALTAATVVPGSIATAARADSYSISASANDVVLLRVGVTAGEMTPSLRVFDADGTLLCTAADPFATGLEISRCALPHAGTYTVLVGDYAGTRVGSYNLYLQRLSSPAGATAFALGSTRAASIQAGAEADTYQFTTQGADVVLVRVGVTAGEMTPSVRVFGGDGTALCAAADPFAPGVEASRCVLPQAGTYTILVGDYRGVRTGSYSMYIQRLTIPADAIAIALDTPIAATLPTAATMHTYAITARGNDTLLLRVGVTAGEMTPALAVYAVDGVRVCATAEPFARGTEVSRCVLPRDGIYTVLVGDYRAIRTGSYQLYVQQLNNPSTPNLLLAGASQTATIRGAAEADTFTWMAGDHDTLQLRMAVTSGELRPSLRVYDPDGVQVCAASSPYAATAEIMSCLLPRSGVYTMLATDTSATHTGTYQISLTCLTSPCGSQLVTTITAAGGQVSLGRLRMTFPPNAVTEPVRVTLIPLPTTASSTGTERVVQSFLVQARTATGQLLATAKVPLTYAMTYSDEELASVGSSATAVSIAALNETTHVWEKLQSQVHAQNKTVSVTRNAFGTMGLLASVPTVVQRQVFLPSIRRR